ncbi:Cobalt-zinc-cadmium resistance protein CzcA [Planctomycetes bacterium LzC2]|uniref:Cobalt-zinc-cadmium resistance protein CzcA n=1 Tax=Alienimonas chondri TaxID=2681879 RepID=A0ABX1VC93_9PLAN|nr:efflux RND transporter permease subunit [Alienimonas chondri]NNJ24857.1 Cobalt-zinc-cadmium resistance protein CzcA [Alienimonas chondri]
MLALAATLLAIGGWQTANLPIDLFPDLNRPRVVMLTEAPGMAPEEVEALITFPLETAVNGATGVEAVCSSSGVGISVINVEFAYGTDIYTDRQIVAERIAAVADRMPEGVEPSLAPVSSIIGQVLILALWTDPADAVGGDARDALELRTLADWVIRQRLLTVPGVAQVFTMGGGRSQYQILVDPDALRTPGVTMEEVREAAHDANRNATGGYLDDRGPTELLVRGLGRAVTLEVLRLVPVATRGGVPVTLVVVILFAFLLNLRTTLVTLTAIPLSVVATATVFAGFDLGINTMTLGGLAVAIGELVDDAIVDVENVHRRLGENRLKPLDERLHPLRVVYGASAEIRGSIVFGTAVVVLFLPLFALQGMEGRLFAPLAAASVLGVFLVLYTLFGPANFGLQVMAAAPGAG